MHYFLAVIVALWYSIRSYRILEIRGNESARYFKKSINFALCYADFSLKNNIFEAINAGKAAFLCCAYDVVTDWRFFCYSSLAKYNSILSSMVSPSLSSLATGLYRSEMEGSLSHHGLERGAVAFIFVTRMMRIEKEISKKANLSSLGMLLQIVDDVLDYEEDCRRSELNCLNSDCGEEYLRLFLEELPIREIQRLFPKGYILKKVINLARDKALLMLYHNKLKMKETAKINNRVFSLSINRNKSNNFMPHFFSKTFANPTEPRE